MNIFLSGEQRRMHRYVDSTIENTLAVMALDGFRETLGENIFDNHKRVIDGLFIPNVRHGQVTLPKSVQSKEAVPIIGLEPGQEVQYGAGAAPTPHQKYRLAQKKHSWAGKASLAEILQEVEDDNYPFVNALIAPDPRAGAAVHTPILGMRLHYENVGRDPLRVILGRPLVTMKMNGGDRLSPRILFHESRHVMQVLNEPVTRDDEKYRRTEAYRHELEAYAVQAIFERALARQPSYRPGAEEDNAPSFIVRDDGSRIIDSSALMIDALRRRANKDRRDKFFPYGALIKKLEEYKIDII